MKVQVTFKPKNQYILVFMYTMDFPGKHFVGAKFIIITYNYYYKFTIILPFRF